MSDEQLKREKPVIEVTKSGPYLVKGFEILRNSMGEDLQVSPVTALCRCGASHRKPYCDGSHVEINFVGEPPSERKSYRVKEYVGREITIVDIRKVCSHSEECIKGSPGVFRKDARPWIDPDGAAADEIMRTVRKCPSGALSYRFRDTHYRGIDHDPAITVSKNGPLEVVGGIELAGESGRAPATPYHYTLCRCGASNNKPFCDGKHHEVEFTDYDN